MIRKTCPVCASGKLKQFHDKLRGDKSLAVISCSACGAMHLDKQFDQEALNKYYVDQYRREFTSELNSGDAAEKFFHDKMPLAKKRIELCLPYLKKKGKNARYLEIGCGPGFFLHQLKKFSKGLYGLELNLEHATYARNLGFTIYTQPLEKLNIDVKFDMIFLFHVLEHIAEPVAYLKKLKGLLKDNGQIVMEVPGVTDPLVSLYRIPDFRSFYFQEPHLYYFSQMAMGLIAKKVGMKAKFMSYSQYGLINHLSWALTGKSNVKKRSGGNDINIALEDEKKGLALFQELNEKYLKLLDRYGYYDTIYAVFSKERQ